MSLEEDILKSLRDAATNIPERSFIPFLPTSEYPTGSGPINIRRPMEVSYSVDLDTAYEIINRPSPYSATGIANRGFTVTAPDVRPSDYSLELIRRAAARYVEENDLTIPPSVISHPSMLASVRELIKDPSDEDEILDQELLE